MGNEGTISWDLRIDGSESSQQKIQNVSQSFTGLDDQTRGITTRFSGVASAGSALGTALSRLDPQVGSLVTAFGSAGGAASGLTSAIGGVGGLVGGGLVAAVGIAIQYFVNAENKAREYRRELERQVSTTKELISTIQVLDQLESKRQREKFGVKTIQDLIAEHDKYQEQLVETEKLHDQIINRENIYGDISGDERAKLLLTTQQTMASLRNTLNYKQQEISLAREHASLLDIEEEETKDITRAWEEQNKIKERGAAIAEKLAREAERKRIEEERSFELLMTSPTDKLGEQLIAESEMRDKIREEGLEKGFDREKQYIENRMRLAERFIKETEAKEKAHQARMQGFVMGYLGTVSGAMSSTLSDLVKGRDVAAAKIIETIGDQMVASGTQHLLEGIAMQFIPFMQGNATGLMAAGAAEIAVGLSMGAAGAAAQSGGSGGGGGGPISGPSSPTPREQATPASEDRSPTVINVYTLKADEEAGKTIHESLMKYQKVRGKAASLTRLG